MKICLNCNQPLFGRRDKKFCNDYCRNNYNNQLNRDRVEVVRNTNNRLRKNYRVLEKIVEDKKRSISKNELHFLDFDFKYLTEVEETKTDAIYYVYDIGYQKLDFDTYLIIVK